MKTKGFGRLIALMLCVAMAFSLSSTAFAAEPLDGEYPNIEVENGATIISGDGVLSVDSTIEPGRVYGITLDPNNGIFVPIGTFSAGEDFTVTVAWAYADSSITSTPSIRIGVQEASASGHVGYVYSNSPKRINYTFESAGTYYLFFGNPSTSYALNVLFQITI